MKYSVKTIDAFFALLRAGLWEQSFRLLPFETLDFDALYNMAEEQSVVGLIAAGLVHVEDRKIQKPEAVPFLKKIVSLETRNQDMNDFISGLVKRMRDTGIYSVLVKGQGVAQCYQRPNWRSSGDIDLLLDDDNYEKAKCYLLPQATFSEKEIPSVKHLGMRIEPWFVELHGSLRNRCLRQMNAGIDEIIDGIFYKGNVRVWRNGETDVFLPSPDADAVLLFSHILQHFFNGGIGLRQICDWARILYVFRDSLDRDVLESRIRSMRILSEWKAFGCLIVKYLGFEKEFFPMYDSSVGWKADYLASFVLEKGNFGRSVDNSYQEKNNVITRKTISLFRVMKDSLKLFRLFPIDSVKAFLSFLSRKVEK